MKITCTNEYTGDFTQEEVGYCVIRATGASQDMQTEFDVLADSLINTRRFLARLVDVLGESKILNEDQIKKMIRY